MTDFATTHPPAGIVPATPGRVSATAGFYAGVVPFEGFGGIADPAYFVPLPDDWVIGLADIEASTAAIGAGRYKTVNTAGAAVISALSNALGTLDFPFIFGGDGASFGVGPEEADAAAEALAATVAWVGSELGLTLRGALVPMREIRAEGLDVQVARFAASPNVTYAMFSGGGLAWAERRLKAGEIALPPAPPGSVPDLTGLSCRFQDLVAKHGVILSVLVRPLLRPQDAPFVRLVGDILGIAEEGPDAGRPVPAFHPLGGVRLRSVAIDGRLQRRPGQSLAVSYVKAAAYSVLACVLLATRSNFRGFSATRYLQEVVANSDFRKYDDGLMLTLDCAPATAARIEERLRRAEREGIASYGLHRQGSASITCVIPSVMQSNHVHFIDGASGGYAMAARDLKSRLASVGPL
jgi:hypothetical protein